MIELGNISSISIHINGHDLAAPHVGEPEAVVVPAGSLTEENSFEEDGGFLVTH
jgi:hypothetical protein